MRVFITYCTVDSSGVVEDNKLRIFFDVRSFSDWHDRFYEFILQKHQNDYIKVLDVICIDLKHN